jgi:cytosine/adenosine deaminase-related metal-dependent hydrolase
MLNYISADCVYPVAGQPLLQGVIGVETDGTIREVLSSGEAELRGIKDIVNYKGFLVPGFINTHCHLELSHLKGKIEQHTGLPKFVEQVILQRNLGSDAVLQAMVDADLEMNENGIVAVGDISNQVISKAVKESSSVYYHTFIEVLGFDPSRAAAIMDAALNLKESFKPLNASIVPHAPYSVSTALFQEISKYALKAGDFGSIHNQECEAETQFFMDKTGGFLGLYEFLGLNISFFKASGRSSLETVLPLLSNNKMLLVHNTYSTESDVANASKQHKGLYWCLCPNANLYIENRLPDVKMLMNAGVKLTLGTDSLASNCGLSILEEMKTLHISQGIGFSEVLKWATYNGAEFLGLTEQFGTLAPGKTPGINLIVNTNGGGLVRESIVKRLY